MKNFKFIIILLFAFFTMQSALHAQADTLDYTKAQINRAIRIALDSVYQKLQTDVMLNLKLDVTAFEDSIEARFDTLKSKALIIDDGVTDPATITSVGGVSGEAGVKVGETVQVEGSSPTVGFKLGANISDLHPPTPMTSSHDWHFQDRSGTIAYKDNVDSLKAGIFSFHLADSSWSQERILFRAPTNMTIDSVAAVIIGGTSVDFNLVFSSNIQVSSSTLFSEAESVTSQTTGNIFTTFNDNTIALGQWVTLLVDDAVGDVIQLAITTYYRRQ